MMTNPSINIFLDLLQRWNKVYNLTAIRDASEMEVLHIWDSLAISSWIFGSNLLDVGTGAGFPSVPLAIQLPELQVTALDSNGKKIRFLHEVQRQLQLPNLEVVQSRAEHYNPSKKFTTITSRAFGDIEKMIHCTRHLIEPNGVWLAMKGKIPHTELQALSFAYEVHEYALPQGMGERCCIIIKNKNLS